MRTRVIASIITFIAVFGLLTPGVAQAADCGTTTVDQWVGTHTGTLTADPFTEPMKVVIEKEGSSGLKITTILEERADPVLTPTGTPAINGEIYDIWWSVIPVEPVYHFASSELSCANGVVTGFSGIEYTWLPGWGMYIVATFELSRSA
ncbi:hypothetical protein [Actinophytocola sediminis]